MRKALFWFSLAVIGAALASPAHAILVSYTVDGVAPQQFPGPLTAPADAQHILDGYGYPGDIVELQTYTGSLDLAVGTSELKINTLLWTIFYTYGNPEPYSDMNLGITAARNMMIDGVGPAALSQTGNLRVGWENDFLSFAGGSTISFIVRGFQVNVTPLALDEAPGEFPWPEVPPPWGQPDRDMMARFDITEAPAAVPDAGTTASLLGLAVLGLGSLRRKLFA